MTKNPSHPSISSDEIAAIVLSKLHADFDTHCVLETINDATLGEFYVMGGTIRNSIFLDKIGQDLDLMIPNEDFRSYSKFGELGLALTTNSQKHRRYRWNRLSIDIFSPNTFYQGFETVLSALEFFDLKINSVAIHYKTKTIICANDFNENFAKSEVGINTLRWNLSNDIDLLVLVIRLIRILYDFPILDISSKDKEYLLSYAWERVKSINWRYVSDRYPLGSLKFQEAMRSVLENRQ